MAELKTTPSGEERLRTDSVRSRSVEWTQPMFAETLTFSQLFKFGLPAIGWMMLIIEIIPTFVYFALTHFHLRYNAIHELYAFDYMVHFYAIIASVPTVFLIAVLSDGYVYGKFIAAVLVLFLATLAGSSTILLTTKLMSSTLSNIMVKISVFSAYFYFVAIPIRLTIFAELISHNKNHPNARKCFTLFWVFNLVGAVVGLRVFKFFFDTYDSVTTAKLTIAMVSLTMIYFFFTSIIAMTLPLQLQTTNLFIYHMNCVCFAIRQQPSIKNWNPLKPGLWLEVASKKFTWTEVKRTKSIYFLSLYIIPVACYFDILSLLYFYWYSTRFAFRFGGDFLDDYSFFYLHLLLSCIISLIVQFFILPILSCITKNFIKDSWILLTGYLFLGVSLAILFYSAVECLVNDESINFESHEVSLVRLINGYPHDINVFPDWTGKLETIRRGEILNVKVDKEHVDTFGETAIFQMPEFKMKNLLAMTVHANAYKNYLLRDDGHQVIPVAGTEEMKSTTDKLSWIHRKFDATILILCSSELSEENLSITCSYESGDDTIRMPRQEICGTQVDYNTGTAIKMSVPTVVDYVPKDYKCQTSDGQVHILATEPRVFYLLYYSTDISSNPRQRILTKESDNNRSSFVLSDLSGDTCSVNQILFVIQIFVHAVATSCLLVSANTMVCLYGPPRLRMISYAVLYVGIFSGMVIIRLTVLTDWKLLDLAGVHLGIYLLGLPFLIYNVLFVKFEMHSWEQPWRPSMVWKIFLWVRNRVLYKKFLSEKGPRVDNNSKTEKSILQSDVDRDRRSEDDKMYKKVTFHQIDVDPSLLARGGIETTSDSEPPPPPDSSPSAGTSSSPSAVSSQGSSGKRQPPPKKNQNPAGSSSK
ncbi:hypothetical protein GE061_012641 [Apolygus lucorum]|uniref:Uncharacterized protein n=1 Tax=Apolygus lucorum TaxID=248454 RepID=A0A8S9XSX6_APOLU|nr:hypothetical protein GE061_012641 [Apolygus lucorum]